MNGIKAYLQFLKDTIRIEYMRNVNENNGEKRKFLKKLKKEVEECKRCSLFRTRTHIVFGEGSENAEMMLVGEAPGREEDLSGRPFVGRAGKLMDEIFEKIGLRRKEIYIANCIKCRPPENRNPKPEELLMCFPYLEKQIEIIQPKVIVCLGKFSAQQLSQTNLPISVLREKVLNYKDVTVIPTFHPAYLLRNPHAIDVFKDDLIKAMNI
ncbi:MAG: uracil-DNA glycosylase [Deltaproteobacteria bacterium]|nr:uracil-DNA glycosylase [Deltaproteobacteria bacterium]